MYHFDLEEKRVLKTTAYYYGASFSNFPSFFNNINQINPNNTLHVSEVERLVSLSSSLKNNSIDISSFKQAGYLTAYEHIIKVLSRELKLFDWPELYLVDEIPCDISGNKSWDAMMVDSQEAKRLNLKEGIYFNKNCVTHCYFEFVICHELIHWAISHYSTINHAYVPLWEEGICDFLSVYFLFIDGILPPNVIFNLLLYNRHFKSEGSIWKHYHVFFNSVILLALQNGIKFLYSFIQQGRDSFSELYNYKVVSTQSNLLNDKDTVFLFSLLEINSYISVDEKVYILLKSLSDKYNQFIAIDEIMEISGLNKPELDDAISDGFNSGLLFVECGSIFIPNKNMVSKLRYKND